MEMEIKKIGVVGAGQNTIQPSPNILFFGNPFLRRDRLGLCLIDPIGERKNDNRASPVRNSNGAFNPSAIIIKSKPAAAAGPE
jgi:hypothetical protein